MYKMKKALFYFSLSLIILCIPLTIHAQELDVIESSLTKRDVIWIENSISISNSDGFGILHAIEEAEEVAAASNPIQVRDDIFTDEDWEAIEEAGDTIRQGMKERVEQIIVPISLRASMDTDTLVLAQNRAIQRALKETKVADEGSYLDFQVYLLKGNISGSAPGDFWNLKFTYNLQYYTTKEQEEEVTERVQQALQELNVDSLDSDYEKTWEIYQYVAQHVTYDYDHLDEEEYWLQYTPYAALVNGTAVCQGYTILLYRMLWEAGVDNHVVEGYSKKGGKHIWNIILMDGLYYNCDATWDSGTEKTNTYFLKCEATFNEDHERRGEYATDAYYELYPMGETDYYLSGTGIWIISYLANGGEGAPSQQEKVDGEPLTLTNEQPIRVGYTFLGWAKDANAKKADYQSGGLFDLDENVVLYAVWEENDKTVIEKSCSILLGDQLLLTDFIAWMAPDIRNHGATLLSSGTGTSFSSNMLIAQTINESTITINTKYAEDPIYVIRVSVLNPDTAIDLPSDLTEIKENAFQNTKVQAVIIPGRCQRIGKEAFAENPGLVYISIPDSVQAIDEDAFLESPNVTIFCHQGTEAYEFARRNDLDYAILS